MAISAVLVNPSPFLSNPTFSTDWANPVAKMELTEQSSIDKFDFRGVVDDRIGGGDSLDYITVDLLKGGHYWLSVYDDANDGLAGMPQIEVFDSAGDMLSVTHLSFAKLGMFPAANVIEFTPTVHGTYHIRIQIDPSAPDQGYRAVGLVDTADVKLLAIGQPQLLDPDELPPPTPLGAVDLTPGDDLFTGTNAPETVSGLGGEDTVLGMGGNDSILGGAGDDDLNGNLGADYVAGGEGADFVRGGQSNDSVHGESGDDWHVNGNMGDDSVDGGEGNDGVFGGAGNDTMRGGAGNDTMSGDLNDDMLFGDAGADTFVFGNGSGSDAIKDFGLATGDVVQLLSNLNGSGIFGFADVLARAGNAPAGVVIDLGGASFLTIEGVTKAQLQADDFLFV